LKAEAPRAVHTDQKRTRKSFYYSVKLIWPVFVSDAVYDVTDKRHSFVVVFDETLSTIEATDRFDASKDSAWAYAPMAVASRYKFYEHVWGSCS
jgi:hypothetical protein